MDLKTWQEQIRQRLARWGQEAKQRVPDTAYGFLSAMALLPVIAAFRENDLTPLLELGRLVAGMGGSLLANQVQAWKDRPDEALEAELARQAEQDEGMRAALDELLNRLDAVDLARQTLGADDRAGSRRACVRRWRGWVAG